MPASVGVCSWSLEPTSVDELADRIIEVGVTSVQLALVPLARGEWSVEETLRTLRDRGIAIRSGMLAFDGEDYSTLETVRETGGVRVDADWEANLELSDRTAALAQEIEVPLVSFHAGFIPHDLSDPVAELMIDRLRQVIDCFHRRNVRLAFETGQESAETLIALLGALGVEPKAAPAARPVGVNFDPANMILYGMGDPIAALKALAPYVVQLHIKDATAATTPGEWGAEVPVGTGEVDWKAFFDEVRTWEHPVDFMIEREAGDQRVVDMRTALEVVRSHR